MRRNLKTTGPDIVSSNFAPSKLPSVFFLAALCLFPALPVQAADPVTITVTLKADAFTPAEVKAPANQPFVLKFINQDAAAAEIEAKDLKIEKVVAGNSEIIVRVQPQTAGRYLFVNEYKEDAVKGFVVVE